MVNVSRVGKKPILIPENVEVKIEGDRVFIKGPKGELFFEMKPEIKIEIKEGKIFVFPEKSASQAKRKAKPIRALWGTARALLSNMIKGATEGYKKELEIQGLGFKAQIEDNDNDLVLYVGFTHPVKIKAPEGIHFSVSKNIVSVSGIDKEKVSQISAKIRKVRPPEPYKGKGIRYLGEVVRKKEGKKAVATAQ